MIKFKNEQSAAAEIMEAMKTGDDEQIKAAWQGLHDSISEQIMQDFEDLRESNDEAILAQRGYRVLTAKEKTWYQKVIDAMRDPNPKQAFTTILGTDEEEALMPNTIIEDVYKHLREEYPLLKAVNFQYVNYLTRWILNDHTKQKAIWGTITDAITKEITSSFKVIDVTQNKLSAFAVIEKGMLDLGPTFLDGYIRAVLMEAMLLGLEDALVNGNGLNTPIGLTRDISEGVSVSSTTGYPLKTKQAVTDFSPATYGALLAQMAKTEGGMTRKFTKVAMAVNMTDYLTKVMPATTVLNSAGAYVNNLFPFPTDVFICNSLAVGDAVLFIAEEYHLLIGGSREGVIEYSDEYKFLEDQRVFKIKQYGAGRAFDNTCALYLDISALDPAYITVKNIPEEVI